MIMGLIDNIHDELSCYCPLLHILLECSKQFNEPLGNVTTYFIRHYLISEMNWYWFDDSNKCIRCFDEFGEHDEQQQAIILEKMGHYLHNLDKVFTDSQFICHSQKEAYNTCTDEQLLALHELTYHGWLLLNKHEVQEIDFNGMHLVFDGLPPYKPPLKTQTQISNPAIQTEQEQSAQLKVQITLLKAQLEQAAEPPTQVIQAPSINNTPALSLTHTNTAIQALFDTMNTYWADPNNPPKQEYIKAQIVEKYPTIPPSMALWIDRIIRFDK